MRDVIVIRYPDAERSLYPCWSQHRDVVDAVTALHATWREAYEHPRARAVDAATYWTAGCRRRCARSATASAAAHERAMHELDRCPTGDSSMPRYLAARTQMMS
jgi:hypothetical protein